MYFRDRAYEIFHYGKYMMRSGKGTRPCVVMSIDFELIFPHLVQKELKGLDALLRFSGDFDFPMTFAIVGNILEKDSSYVRRIKVANRRNEIGSHSYSHKFFDRIGREEAEEEVSRSVNLLNGLGESPASFVFPRNAARYIDLLPKHGFRCFRSFHREKHELSPPRRTQGIWDLPQSLFVYNRRSPGSLVRLARIAERKGLVFHIWCHPYNWGENGDPYRVMVTVLKPLTDAACFVAWEACERLPVLPCMHLAA